jgi:2-polyprenyl-3-methyl-5-hydroxy-6-metoxy-1,4-benzoquinol methylase
VHSLESFQKAYETERAEVVIHGRRFTLFVPKSLDAFMDPTDVFHDFPLWAKMWEASMVLADHIAAMAPEPDKRFLEIGCGLGLVGIVAAAFGHRVLMTEYNQDALHFVRANALMNLAAPDSVLEIRPLDWSHPEDLSERFDYIVGSEVIYKQEHYDPLLSLIKSLLKPTGEVILAEGVRKTSVEFFKQMQTYFHVQGYRKVFRSKDKEVKLILCRMKPRG